ncbi:MULTISPECIES: L-lactate permease [unclassified Bradyrhizobium]
MAAFVSIAPLALIVLLMAVLRWSAASAGLVGLVAAAAGAIGFFGFGTRIYAEQGIARVLIGTGAEAAFSAADIVWIILPALSLYELQQRSGAIDAIRRGLMSLSSDETLLALVIAWFFASFMEGAAGFGTPIALAAPLLVSLGYTPVVAVALPLIGHVTGTSFGALGTPILAQADVSGISGSSIAPPTALLHASLAPLLVLSIVFIASKARFQVKYAAWAIVAAICFLLPYLVLAMWVGPELPTIGGALAGGLAFAFVLRRMHPQQAETLDARSLAIAALPYAVLVGLILVTRLVPQIRDPLRQIVLEWGLPGPFSGRVELLYHPGTMLLAGFLFGGLLQGCKIADLAGAVTAAIRRLVPVAAALFSMLAIARLMVHAGMIEALAETATRTGQAWPLLAPSVGAIGSFITGSTTVSNILLTDLQQATAAGLGLPMLALIAAQGFGAAVGNCAALHNIITGAATVGLQGREGDILRKTGPVCLGYLALGGVLALTFARWFPF